jgi:hypothetical protein
MVHVGQPIAGEVERVKNIRDRGMPGLNTVVMLD